MPTSEPVVARTRTELAAALAALRKEAGRIALVPTMGALHPGHLSLFDRARATGSGVAASIFVNPIQFGPGEDLARYPRDLEGDLALLAPHGVGVVFAPPVEEMYPSGTPLVSVVPGPLGDRLCGAYRPGHFSGVLTVVAKLFGLFRPEIAIFGRKDLQQAVLIERMAADLELGVEIVVAPLVREEDGLAMSSRNRYLSAQERREALALSRALEHADAHFRQGGRERNELLGAAESVLAEEPGVRMQYLDLVHPRTLEPIEAAEEGGVIALAAHVGETRLIDNIVLGAAEPDPRIPATTQQGAT